MRLKQHKGMALLILAVSQLILALDYTIIFVAVPSLAADLGFTASRLQWVVSAYSLTYGGFLLIGGRLSDFLGRRRMFRIAMVIFGLGSLLGGLAESQLMMIIARGIQGIGGALLSPATLSLIMSNFEEGRERNRALAVWASMGGIGLSLGLLLGGVLTSYIGWEATFYVNVPIALLAILLSPTLVESKAASDTRRYDVAGALSVTAGMIGIVYYLIQSPVAGWLSIGTLPYGVGGIILLLIFIALERRVREPLVPFRLFRIRNLTGAALTAALFSASFGALYYFLTLYMQNVLHYSAVLSGLSFLPLTLSALLGAKIVNKAVSAAGVAGTIALGMALGAIGFMLLTRVSETGSAWSILPGIVAAGMGQALVFTTMYIAAGTGVGTEDQGVASAIVTTGQQIGGSVGLAVIMALISARLGIDGALEALVPADLNGAIRMAFFINALIALLGILVAFFSLRQKTAAAEKKASSANGAK